MIVLVPISRFRVHYEIAEGYPFSTVERLALQAVADDVATVDDLVRTFHIHPRLLIEALITLLHAGWIALGNSPDRQFVITPAGLKALENDELPDSIQIRRRQAVVILDQVSGGIVREGEARYITKLELKKADLWKECIVLRSKVFDNKLDEGRVQHLLPRSQGQRLRWIGPVDLDSRGAQYLPIMVSIEDETLINLPESWDEDLRCLALEAAKSEATKRAFQKEMSWDVFSKTMDYDKRRGLRRSGRRSWQIEWETGDLLTNRHTCAMMVQKSLNEARSAILIASSALEVASLESYSEAISGALARGVDVDVLPAHGVSKSTYDWLKKLDYDCRVNGAKGRLRFPTNPSRSPGSGVVWDRVDESFSCVLFGDAILGSPGDPTELLLGIQISHPAILSELSWFFSGLWSDTDGEGLSSAPSRWQKIAAQLEASVVGEPRDLGSLPEGITAQVKFDGEVALHVREVLATAQIEVNLVGSVEGENDVQPLSEGFRPPIKNVFAYTGSPESLAATLEKRFDIRDARTIALPAFAGNLILADRTICFTTGDVLGGKRRYDERQFALIIDGCVPAKQIKEIFVKS